MMVTISGRIEKDLLKEIDKVAKERGMDRSTVLREALKMWLREKKLEEALELLRKRKVTVWKAAEIAGISYWEMLEKLKEENIPFPISREDLRIEFEELSGK